MKLLAAVALISGLYDLLLGGALVFALSEIQMLLGVEPPRFPINANLNGLFALAVGAGYLAVWRRPQESLWYFWIMGVFLKGGGAVLFILDHLLRASPPVFLLFAASDGALAALTGYALVCHARKPATPGDVGPSA